MTSRAETAAGTRRDLLDAATALLDEGGPEAVTLRAVGSRAGVSRGAPYGHFADKEDLVTAVAVEAWTTLTRQLRALTTEPARDDRARLLRALSATLEVARTRPHLYAVMFATPRRDPEALIRAASESQEVFLALVAAVVGAQDARRTGAALMAGVHGVAGLDVAGHLGTAKWGSTGEEILTLLVDRVAG
ncbi:MAG: TetR/AcrR family transcriptional regulator [Cellulomonadaceae bacterium]|nr:TetR/AcrR family transcriptional regulator [Cellulomonadaceae bacterium]